jgi:diacylglycerol kinase (ATP)
MAPDPRKSPDAPATPFKSRPGLARVWAAGRFSWQGLSAAFRHEAAFRQELAIGVPLCLVAGWVARSPGWAFALVGVVVVVWVVELLNSALEALADAISTEAHPLLGRAKDLGSAAVMLSLVFAGALWVWALFDRFGGTP